VAAITSALTQFAPARVSRYLVGFVLLAQVAAAQSGTVSGVVVSREGNVPLPFSAVSVNGGPSLLASDSGRFRFVNIPVGKARVHVQRIGYFPRDVDIDVSANETAEMRIELTHVPVHLSEVQVNSRVCTVPGRPRSSDAALLNVFQQLTLNAEQFRLFYKSYPFVAAFTRRFSRQYELASRDSTGAVARDSLEVITKADVIAIKSESDWRYKHGEVIIRDFTRGILPSYGVAIPNLAVFADNEFISWHCFYDAGEVTTNGVKERRIDFMASQDIDKPDLDGSLYLDPESFLIRRTFISLSRTGKATSLYDSVGVETFFSEVVPGVALIAKVRGVSLQKRDEGIQRVPELIRSCVADIRDIETQHLTAIEFKDTSSALLRIGTANLLFAASSGPETVRRVVSITDSQNKEPIAGAQVRDSVSGVSVFTNKEGLVDVAWFPQRDTLTLVVDRPQYQTAKVHVLKASSESVIPLELTKGFSAYRDNKAPFVTCPSVGH
jgi:hypothetical protein